MAANVGDQFGATNRHLIPKVFGWFYFAINFGSMISTLLIPVLLNRVGPHVAFGTPGLLMFVATWIFWLGRRKFVHIPPGGMAFVRETFSLEGLRSVGKLVVIYLFVAVFWSLYDQTSSAWVLQARAMDLRFLGVDWLPAQVHALNPILILILIPVFTYLIYPAVGRVFPLTPSAEDHDRFLFDGDLVPDPGVDRVADRRGLEAEHCLAIAGLRGDHGGGGHGVDHLPRVFLHPGPEENEIAGHVDLQPLRVRRQPVHFRRQQADPEPGRHREAHRRRTIICSSRR